MSYLYECPTCGHEQEHSSRTTVFCSICLRERARWIVMICLGKSLDKTEEKKQDDN